MVGLIYNTISPIAPVMKRFLAKHVTGMTASHKYFNLRNTLRKNCLQRG